VLHSLIYEHRVGIIVLQEMCTRHLNLNSRDCNSKYKASTTLRAEFISHKCTDACLVLRSEAALAGIVTESCVSDNELTKSNLVLSSPSRK
jgi:hypothetical protein